MITYPDGFPEGQIKFNIDDTPRKITGIQKVAQMLLKILLTTKGSDVIYPNRGTQFPNYAINANQTLDNAVLRSELALAVRDAETQVKAATASSSDPSSQLARVQIAGIDLVSEGLVMYLQMITKAGATAQVAVPFPELTLS
jgi:phage baseplate assembly protein W